MPAAGDGLAVAAPQPPYAPRGEPPHRDLPRREPARAGVGNDRGRAAAEHDMGAEVVRVVVGALQEARGHEHVLAGGSPVRRRGRTGRPDPGGTPGRDEEARRAERPRRRPREGPGRGREPEGVEVAQRQRPQRRDDQAAQERQHRRQHLVVGKPAPAPVHQHPGARPAGGEGEPGREDGHRSGAGEVLPPHVVLPGDHPHPVAPQGEFDPVARPERPGRLPGHRDPVHGPAVGEVQPGGLLPPAHLGPRDHRVHGGQARAALVGRRPGGARDGRRPRLLRRPGDRHEPRGQPRAREQQHAQDHGHGHPAPGGVLREDDEVVRLRFPVPAVQRPQRVQRRVEVRPVLRGHGQREGQPPRPAVPGQHADADVLLPVPPVLDVDAQVGDVVPRNAPAAPQPRAAVHAVRVRAHLEGGRVERSGTHQGGQQPAGHPPVRERARVHQASHGQYGPGRARPDDDPQGTGAAGAADHFLAGAHGCRVPPAVPRPPVRHPAVFRPARLPGAGGWAEHRKGAPGPRR